MDDEVFSSDETKFLSLMVNLTEHRRIAAADDRSKLLV